ncbi:MAG TPA: YihY/virulence factor BrkB family protein [Stellaceae bacterium]|nr:YihY/virulence factor BrkB family protein [Stellaceae bacterium]
MADTRVLGGNDRATLMGLLIAVALTLYGGVAQRRHARHMVAASRGATSDRHGRGAAWPSEIPSRGWRDIALRVKDNISRHNTSLIAAGIAFYVFLSIPSVITALVSLYGLVFDPRTVAQQVEAMHGVLPADVIKLLSDQLQAITARPASTLGVGLLISVLLAIWSARSAVSALISALNITYEEPERRNFFWLQAISFGMTLGAVLFALVALGLVAVLPAVIHLLPLGEAGRIVAEVARWPILLVLVMVTLAAIYRYAPSRQEPRWRWVSWGAVVATALWLAGSAAFSLYVGKFASYDRTYGSLGAVVVLLLWLYLTAFTVLLGAELNAEIEHQTARDSTTGRQRPIGERGARVADTIGAAR